MNRLFPAAPFRLRVALRPLREASLVCLLLTGCGKPTTAIEKADKQQILLLGNGAEPQDLDPQVVTGVPEDNILRALFEGLVSEDPHDLHPVPGTAESWDISPDGKVYTFHLRKEAKWTDGEPVTADDFLQSYKRILSPALASEYNYMLFDVKNAEPYSKGDLKDFSQVGFKALDAHTLQVTLNNSTPYFLSLLNHYSWFAVPIHTILKFGKLDQRGTRWTRPGDMVSNGPFRLKEWKTNSIIVVEKNPYYWDKDKVRLNGIDFFPIDDSNSEERAFRSGQLHITETVPLPKIDTYRNTSLFRNDPYLGNYFYRINVTKPFLKIKELRQALSLAIDRESIVRNVTRAGEKPATSFTPPGTAGYYPKPELRTDIPAAKALLAKAGFPDGRGLPPIEILYNSNEAHRVIAEALQEMWKKNLGIDVQLINQEWKAYLDAQLQMDYQICRAGWIGDYADPNSFLNMWLTAGGNNETGWSNPEYDRLIAEAGRTTDPAARLAVFQKAESILLDEMPILPIYFYTSKFLIQPSVKGWYPTILNQHPYKYVYLEE